MHQFFTVQGFVAIVDVMSLILCNVCGLHGVDIFLKHMSIDSCMLYVAKLKMAII